MINFRFHIVSLIAIFLALALGVVIGAGVIDRGVVDTLNDRLNRIEAKSAEQQLLNDILNAANERDSEFIELSQPWMLEGRLTGELVAFVAVRGVDEARVQATIVAAEQAGSTVSGVLWLEEKWGEPGEDARELADADRRAGSPRREAARSGLGRARGAACAPADRLVGDRSRSPDHALGCGVRELPGNRRWAHDQRVPGAQRTVRSRHRRGRRRGERRRRDAGGTRVHRSGVGAGGRGRVRRPRARAGARRRVRHLARQRVRRARSRPSTTSISRKGRPPWR